MYLFKSQEKHQKMRNPMKRGCCCTLTIYTCSSSLGLSISSKRLSGQGGYHSIADSRTRINNWCIMSESLEP